MKKLSTLLLSIIATSVMYAQPAFNSGVVPANGSTVSVQSATYTGTNPSTSSGANQTWDYSGLVFSDPAATSTISTNVAGSTYGSSFPNATHYEIADDGSFYYYNSTTSQATLEGYYSEDLIVYSNPLTELVYPIAYTDVQTDNYATSYTSNGFPVTVTGTITTTFDGYGTLVTPTGTYNNIGRFKAVKDETIVTDFGIMTLEVQNIATTYSWNLPGEGHATFAILYLDITMDGSPLSSTSDVLLYGNSTVTGTTQPELVTASLYPQPASDQVTIIAPGVEGVAKATLFTSNGAVLRREDLVANAGTMTLNVSDVPSGLYLIEITNGNKSVKQKIVVE